MSCRLINMSFKALASSPAIRAYLDDPRIQDQPLTAALKKVIGGKLLS